MVIRAGLREAGRVLGNVLCSSGLSCKFACLRTILQSKWPAFNPINPYNAKINLITLNHRVDTIRQETKKHNDD